YMPRSGESAEMIETDRVDVCQQRPCPIDPPPIAIGAERIPVVDWIAPALSVRAEVIRGDAGDDMRPVLGIEQEQFRVGPDVSGVRGDEERKIANQAHSFRPRVRLQPRPLTGQQELNESHLLDLAQQLPTRAIERRARAAYEIVRPLQVARARESGL